MGSRPTVQGRAQLWRIGTFSQLRASTSCQTALLDLLLCVFQGCGSFTLIKGHQFPLGHQTQHLFSGSVFIFNNTILVCTFLPDTFSPATSLTRKGLHSSVLPSPLVGSCSVKGRVSQGESPVHGHFLPWQLITGLQYFLYLKDLPTGDLS